jgi:NAD(P)-dependent dehydrogenase (short-subunit alcohol dehydrogenase family)
MELQMKQKTALVTGAAGCLGSELSGMLVRSGWNVVMLDNNRRGLELVYDRHTDESPGQAALYPLDLAGADPELFEELLSKVEETYGGLDALVHCAAHFEGLTPAEHVQPEEWLMSMQVNVNAPWLLSSMALPLLRQSDSGKLLFMLDDLARVEGALWGVYGVSKHALSTLTKQLCQECRSGSIEVKGVDPGPMRSAIRTRVYHAESPAEMPSPEAAATEITAYLNGKTSWNSDFIELQ